MAEILAASRPFCLPRSVLRVEAEWRSSGPSSPGHTKVTAERGRPKWDLAPQTSCSFPVSPEGPASPQPPARFRSPQRDLTAPNLLLVSGLPRGTWQPPTLCSFPVSPEGPGSPHNLPAHGPIGSTPGPARGYPGYPGYPWKRKKTHENKTSFPIPGKPGTPYPWPGLGLKTIPHHPAHPFCSSCALWLRPRPISMKKRPGWPRALKEWLQ